MLESSLQLLVCPDCQSDLFIKEIISKKNDRIETGSIECRSCKVIYPIHSFIPRFVERSNYARNFGYQWNKYTVTQYDSKNETKLSEERFYKTTKWPKSLKGELILEAGSGAGRFTEIVLETGAVVASFDFSTAVEANYRMNGLNPRLLIVQADIFNPPFKYMFFDRVFCMGVLQHTPDPQKAFKSLSRFLKLNGYIVIDIYIKKGVWDWLTSYRRIRWITRYMDVATVDKITRVYVDAVWPLTKWLWKFGKCGRRIARYVFLTKDRFWRKGLCSTDVEQKESIALHLIDQLCAYHDKPQSPEAIENWLKSESMINVEVEKGGNGVIGRGQRPGNI